MFTSFFSKKEYDLDGKRFKQKFEESSEPVLIDVRTPSDYASGTIPGAQNMDLMSAGFESRVARLDPVKTYFLFCRSGSRSGRAAAIFEKAGLKSYNLAGGIGAWPQ